MVQGLELFNEDAFSHPTNVKSNYTLSGYGVSYRPLQFKAYQGESG